MKILVNHIDVNRNVSNKTFEMTYLAFVKHLAIAGQGYAPSTQKLFRTIGMFLHYNNYMRLTAFENDKFSEPPIELSDPTDKAQFSNLVGKAIADFLSKRIDNSLYTVNYEAVMRLKNIRIMGSRPDLMAYSSNAMFSLETKGRHNNSPGDMISHKNQAKALHPPDIMANFSIACISYNLYNKIKCNYHDPFNENVNFDNEALGILSKEYYKGFLGFLDNRIFKYDTITVQGEKFYKVRFSNYFIERYRHHNKYSFLFIDDYFHFIQPNLILPANIRDLAQTGITSKISPFIHQSDGNNTIYIDNDRIGLSIGLL